VYELQAQRSPRRASAPGAQLGASFAETIGVHAGVVWIASD